MYETFSLSLQNAGNTIIIADSLVLEALVFKNILTLVLKILGTIFRMILHLRSQHELLENSYKSKSNVSFTQHKFQNLKSQNAIIANRTYTSQHAS